jgi:hypothetical protein
MCRNGTYIQVLLMVNGGGAEAFQLLDDRQFAGHRAGAQPVRFVDAKTQAFSGPSAQGALGAYHLTTGVGVYLLVEKTSLEHNIPLRTFAQDMRTVRTLRTQP